MSQFLVHGLMLASSVIAAPAAQTNAPQQLLAVADAFDRAQLTKDAATLDKMVADDLIFIEASGKRSGKHAFIAGWTAAGDRFDPVTLVDRRIVSLGREAFLVTAETTLTGSSDGKRFASAFRFTDTFRWSHGRWQAVHIQVTRLPAGK
ncbi:nuclear transport factor 2 family protein [Sphingomonas sp. DG1-23]|uniref:nuclear transport factor 2 family protein n=1 Tax=Sphingomonas sp. DG1-23 TaxID=3068316 RepID=UPI00273F8FEC|nr:nuclear transport factor 2 family protein [Sphingomonas sp. DG1-23]MDP5280325.1 nuclear transport factor 2 family protein [Sphingomonas sp. DG1-23]